MKRHDTHLLSDESEKEKKEEDSHHYSFNISKNSSNISEEKYITKENEDKKPFHLNLLNKNNIEENKNKDNNISIISTQELQDIFCNEDNIKKIQPQTKKKPKKNKYFIKLRKLELNKENNEEIIYNNFSYDFLIRDDYLDKNIENKNRNCVSLNNVDKRYNLIKDEIKIKKRKKDDNLKEKEIIYFFYNDNYDGRKKLKNIINIINKNKLKFLKISNNYFSIKTKKKRFKKKIKLPDISKNNNNKYAFEMNENYDREVRKRKIHYSQIVREFNLSKFQKDNKLVLKNNKKLILKSTNTSNISIKNNLGKTPNQSISYKSTKNTEKMQLLYNIYCEKQNKKNNKIQRIKSTDSLIEKKQKESAWVRMNNYEQNIKLSKINNDKGNRSLIKNDYNNYKLNIGSHHNNDFNLHFGNNDNCPICKAFEQKNEGNIQKMGIPYIGNENVQNSWKNRRVYSALSRVLGKWNKNMNDLDIINNKNNNSLNKSKNRNISKENKPKINNIHKSNSIILNAQGNKNYFTKNSNAINRKLNYNKDNYRYNNFPTTSKFLSTKNNSVKYN